MKVFSPQILHAKSNPWNAQSSEKQKSPKVCSHEMQKWKKELRRESEVTLMQIVTEKSTRLRFEVA